MIIKKGLPSRYRRFCCEKLKEYKILDKAIIGVRKCESVKRSLRYQEPTECRFYGSKKEHVEAIYPILDWTNEDVEEFIKDREIRCAPVYYDENGQFHVERRLGCLCCPLISTKKRISEFKKYPGMVVFYVHALKLYRDNHPCSKSVATHKDEFEQFAHDVFYPGSIEWEAHKNGILNEDIDYKKLLEDYFGVNL